MPHYWLTTTWPVDPADEPHTRHVFLLENRKHVPAVGDVVFYRESASLPTDSPVRMTDGKTIHLSPGTGGLFCKAEVAAEPVDLPIKPPFPAWLKTYDFGNLDHYTRVARCHRHVFRRHCSMAQLAGILGVKRISQGQNLFEVTDPVAIDQLLKCF